MVRETQREREYSLWRGSMAWNKEATSPPWSFKEYSRSDILKPPSTFPPVCAVAFQWFRKTGILRTRCHFDACGLFWLAPGDTAQGQPAGKHTVWRTVICHMPCVLCLIVSATPAQFGVSGCFLDSTISLLLPGVVLSSNL